MNEFDGLFSVSGLSLDRLRSFLEVVEAGNIAKAAKSDPTRQSQFSRQIKELESFFGVALTRRVGRRIEITEDGHRLARLIRQHFTELNAFREVAAGRPIALRFGAAGSIIEWLLVPRLAECRSALGEGILEFEQSRSADVVRGVTDGRLDFGIVRDDALSEGIARRSLGAIGYGLFAPKGAWKGDQSVRQVMETFPVAELLPGGRFQSLYHDLCLEKGWRPQVVARVSSFVQLGRLVAGGKCASVLPLLAESVFDPRKIIGKPLPWRHQRAMSMIWNSRSLERDGIPADVVDGLVEVLSWKGGSA